MILPFIKAKTGRELQSKLDAAREKLKQVKAELKRCKQQLREARHAIKTIAEGGEESRSLAPVIARMDARQVLSYRHLRGQGLEIGALHRPTPMAAGAHTKYYDYLSAEENRKRLPELANEKLVHVDYIGDGEKLEQIADGSLDYLIANHMLEHCQNVIATMRVFWSKLKDGGVLFITLPDKRFTFDYRRELTPFEHLQQDEARGPGQSLYDHYVDFQRNVVGTKGGCLTEAEVRALPHVDVHFHVWTQVEIIEMFLRMRREHGFEWEIAAIMHNGHEVVVVARKEKVVSWDRANPSTRPSTA